METDSYLLLNKLSINNFLFFSPVTDVAQNVAANE